MNLLNIVGLTFLMLIITFMALRVERGRLWVVVVLLIVPGVIAVARWASVGGHWPEVLTGGAIAALVTGVWWFAGGRRLARPSSDSIKVWGQEKVPKLKASEAAALQAEVAMLREDRERLEAEVKRLKGGGGKASSGSETTTDDGRRTTDH